MIFICSLIFLFLIKIRFPKGVSISEILTKRYGQQGLKIFRETEKVDFKLKKIKCDIEFLKTCISNNLQPDFVKFKLYNKRLHSAPLYQKFVKELLENELQHHLSQERVLTNKLKSLQECLRNTFSFFDHCHLNNFILNSNSKKIEHVTNKQDRKLFKFGLKNKQFSLDSKKVIHN